MKMWVGIDSELEGKKRKISIGEEITDVGNFPIKGDAYINT